MLYNERDIARFWSKVNKTDTCWPWSAACSSKGYGIWSIGTRKTKRTLRAHRFSWEIHNGSIPNGVLVLHRCDVRMCINPDHLFLGSFRNNMDDMLAKDRQAKGIRNARAKLTEAQVRKIKEDTRLGRIIAAEYYVSEDHVSKIRKGIKWKHL